MKKWMSLLLSLLLVVSMLPAACAAVEEHVMDADYVYMHTENGLLIVEDYGTDLCTIVRPDGTKITDTEFVYAGEEGAAFEVALNDDSQNCLGILSADGQFLVPAQYGDVEYLSERWQVGAVMVPGTVENYDFKDYSDSSYYLVGNYDVYYCGQVVGQLSRTGYDYAYARGDYLYVCDKEGNYTYYDNTFTASSYIPSYGSSQEYDEVYGKGYFHQGSGQQAFVPSCTLTADQVEVSFVAVKDQIVDLQGNVIGQMENAYDYVFDFEGDYALVEEDDKYGLIHKSGREVLPCIYDDINCIDETYFEGGYQIVVKDGKVGYVDLDGNVTCPFKYAENVVESTYNMPFNTVTDLDGNVIVLSGKVGELPQRFLEVQLSYYDGCPLFVALVEEDKAGVFDLNGNVVIPADGRYDDVYDFEISADGTVIVARDVDYHYSVYTVTNEPDILGAAAQVVQAMAAQTNAEEQTADAGWKCTCGSENTGNFCPECGSARPADKLVCQNCGFEPAEGETPKFCSECGTAF